MSKADRHPIGCSGKSGQDPTCIYVGARTPGSRKFVRGALERIAKFLTEGRETACTLDWSRLRFRDVERLRQHLKDTSAPRTARNRIALFRGALRSARRLSLISIDRYNELTDLEPIRGDARVRAARALPADEIEALFRLALSQPDPRAARDAALIAVLYGSGLRRGELVELKVYDYERASGAVRVRRGKGMNDRLSYVPTVYRFHVERWLSFRQRPDQPLFVAIARGGRLVEGHLTPDSIGRFCRRFAERAGIAHFTAHDLRRSFTTDLLAKGIDPLRAASLLGHRSVQITRDYDLRGEKEKQEAVEALTRDH